MHVENLNAAKDAPDWHRERFFQHDAWLDSSKAPFQTEVALSPASGGARATRKRVSYTVTVRTSDLRGAGTDATVSLEISGSEAKMGWTRLPDDDGNPFGRGASDEFTFEGVDVGVVEKIAVKHDGRGLGPAWHLASVDVRHNGTGAVTTFPCGDWLSNETCLERSLVPGASSGPGADVDEFRYRVEVVTGEGLTSGTDAKVSIALLAEGLDHPWALDLHQRDETFDAGRVDTFVFGRTDELGPILGVGLRCANAGVFGDSWFVERVSVASLADGREWVFHHGDWVRHGGVMLRDGVMVSAGIANEAASASASAKAAAIGASSSGASAIPTEYRVTFFTGGEFGAGRTPSSPSNSAARTAFRATSSWTAIRRFSTANASTGLTASRRRTSANSRRFSSGTTVLVAASSAPRNPDGTSIRSPSNTSPLDERGKPRSTSGSTDPRIRASRVRSSWSTRDSTRLTYRRRRRRRARASTRRSRVADPKRNRNRRENDTRA